MIRYQDIQDVHLEISTLCNASCAWCPRTFWGYPYNDGYPELNLSLTAARQILKPEFLQQLKSIYINGNFGDIVMNPQGADIVDYFREHNSELRIDISTNGAARGPEFWQQLANSGATVYFCLDGLEDTHHLYRQNTVWATVIKNARTFIAAGGRAVWKFIQFDHNQHQIAQCQQLSNDLGFAEFQLVDDGRNTAPVFDRDGNLVHVLGNYSGETDIKVLFHKKKTDRVLLEDVATEPQQHVTCHTQKNKSIYIAATGEVFPCCWTGFYPRSFGHGNYHQVANAQLQPLIHRNNALEHELADCIQWFEQVQESWKLSSYQQGRLLVCDNNCGTEKC
jgi:MoaA/NifB/PqqE/SkfB family radical SAM enzyme